MQTIDGHFVYSATDLVGFLECEHLAHLERAAAAGFAQRPIRTDPVLERIAQRGRDHEARYLATLEADGRRVVEIPIDGSLPFAQRLAPGRDATIEAMRAGADVIYQAVLFDERRLGFADFLLRVEHPSDLGAWSYEVWDTKLARHAKASAVLQIAMYSSMVADIQGREPESMYLALGGVLRETVPFRVSDYAAYYRSVARDLEAMLGTGPVFPVVTVPEPVEHCDVCAWSLECRARWRADDDLSLVAGLTARQRRALHTVDVTTRTGLAEPPQPLPERLEGAGRDALVRIRAQAAIQVRGERERQVISELVPPARERDGTLVPNAGLLMLPKPSPGDLFFDMEGDPFFGSDEVDGIDYLFGVIEPGRPDAAGVPAFHALWSIEDGTVTPAAEGRAFEAFIDLVMERLAADPELHVYHYASYEATAMGRMAQRHGTREEEVDRLLRGGVFVDLYRAVRQGIRASVESYSIKRLEPLYGFTRDIDMRTADKSIVEFETWLELGQGAERNEVLHQIELYNRDDCVSTWRLRDWLEEQRAALEVELNEALPRPQIVEPADLEDSEAQRAVQQLADALVANVPDDLDAATDVERGRWLLAHLLNWYRREAKSFWWRYFLLKDQMTDEERRETTDALGELTFDDSWPDPSPGARSTVYRFRFPRQEHKIDEGDSPHDPATGAGVGTVVAINDEAGWIDLKVARNRPAPTPTSLIPYDLVRPQPKPESLQHLASWVLANGLEAPGSQLAARDLLMRRPPRLGQVAGESLLRDGEQPGAAARRLVLNLDSSYLAIQGPPGSGKSTVGAEMIVDLVAAGKRVGVTANSHKVIGELLKKAVDTAGRLGVAVLAAQRGTEEQVYPGAARLKSSAEAQQALASGAVNVVGGTGWLWASDEMAESVDVLFIDEAGQMSLTDAIAASRGAHNLVLLGDPQQLDQPLQGSHPPGADRSALGHLLDGARVIPEHLGLFLDGTWRLHPDIAAYTSEVFYEGRLHAHPGREALDLSGVAPLSGTGLRFIPVPHERHSSDAPEEAAAIAGLVGNLLDASPTWTDAQGNTKALSKEHVLIITPYNAQVSTIGAALSHIRTGTVDKFQGQEAPLSIYSMATSSAEEAPRGLEFLYSLNRLNVATSRAQCLAVVVASPSLLRVRCRTPRQMRLVNALARFMELATVR